MVKIAVAGGSGELGCEVVEALVATKKHEIIILTRKVSDALKILCDLYLGADGVSSTKMALSNDATHGLSFHAVDYSDISSLVRALQGIHTVLSFVNQPDAGDGNNSQKNLIEACIAAGVKRFAPSEYGSAGKEDLHFWAAKNVVKEHLEKVNEGGKVLEYTLFQPGLFLDYLASPHKTAKYVTPLDTFIDFQNRRAIVVQGYDTIMALTAVRDIAGAVARAVEYEGEWPTIGGIRGNRIAVSQILMIGERVRGRPFDIETVTLEDLKAGNLAASWSLGRRHPSFTDDKAEELAAMLKVILISTLLSSAKGAWDVSDEWNRLLPDHRFIQIEDFLTEVWSGKQ